MIFLLGDVSLKTQDRCSARQLTWMKRRVCRLRANAIIVVALLLCIAASWAVASAMVQRARHAAETRAFAEARGLSRLLAAEWSRTIVQIGSLEKIAAIVTRASLAGESPDAAMHELRLAMIQVGPDIAQVAAIAPNGYILWSNLPLPAAPVDLSEREHFRAIAIDGQDFFTGSPVLGKVSGQRTVQMSAAVRDNNGALQAVVVVSVDAAMLGRIAQTLGAEHHSIFALVRRDRRLLMRSEPLPPNQTDDATISDVDEAFTHGSLERLHRSPQDGVRRFFALKAVPGTDTLVAAGVDEADIMQATEAAVVGIWQQTAMLSVVLIIAALAISFGVQRTKTLNAERARNAAVAESEALMRQFSDRATDMIGLLDEGFNYIYANAALCRMLATTPEQLLGTRAGGHVVAEHKHRVISTINALIDGLDSVRVDYQVHHGNGSIVWIETELVLFRAENATRATNLRYIAISRDVTERKVAEASLIEAHENLDALLRESQVLLFRDQYRLDAPKRLRLVGAKEATIWGWPTADVERQGFLPSHLDAASSQAFLDMRRDCARNGHAVAELRFKAANGDWRWMRIHCIRIEQSADTAELLHLASDVTIEFESRQFREQTERLAVIGEVCAGIAHEVNQPLAVIAMAAANGLMELERFPDVSQRVAAKFQRIEKQALRVE